MPYIDPRRRVLIATPQPRAPVNRPQSTGELTWLVTKVIEQYREGHSDNYQTFAEIVAALEQSKDEFQRRVIHPYENEKRRRNGEVYAPVDGLERRPVPSDSMGP